MHQCEPQAGFTMIEMIVVIIIIGVLAVVAVPRMLGKSEFEAYAFNDEAQAVVRYAQKTAIAQRRPVYVVISASSIQACFTDATCATNVPSPSKPGAGLTATAPSGTTLSPATSFFFNGLGVPSIASNLTVTMGSSVSRQFTVQAQTGLVHE
ncbi:MAG: GspH/FimT family pseudopilin [Burkholderiales bacterium]